MTRKRASKAAPAGRARRPFWWGDGAPPLERWPGVTIDIVPTWSSANIRWESHSGKYFFDADVADRICQFFPTFLTHHIGEFVGQPFELLEYQSKLIVRPLWGWKHAADGRRRFVKAFDFLPKGNGKALALDTPIPTPSGWTSMGDVSVGDHVFDDRGRPTVVLSTSKTMAGRECYEVEFDDGSVIVADANHLWSTEARRGARFAVRTTLEILETLRNSNGKYQSANHSVPLAGPLVLPSAELPIDPYVLGAWLGDGDSDVARITVGEGDTEILEHIAACGVGATKQAAALRYSLGVTRGGDSCARGHSRSESNAAGQCRACERARDMAARRGQPLPVRTNTSLQERLRDAGLLNNKHVPPAYLRAAVEQRLALLQGLMDTDGYISPESGECEFCSTDEALVSGALEVVLSLGVKCAVKESAAKLYGREVSRRWRLHFFPPADLPVFRLRRKLKHQIVRHARRRLSGERRIVDVRRVASVPVKCITVGSYSQLFLAGRAMVPTHNSPLGAGLGVYGARMDGEAAAEVYCVAADREQARIVFENGKIMVEGSDDLSDGAEILRDSICWGNCVYKVLSSDAATKHGFRPYIVIFDEIHAQKSRALYEALKRSMVKRRQPLMIIMTHAGEDDEGIGFEEYEYAKNVLSGTNPDESCLPVIFEADAKDDWTDEAVLQRVNPGYGITVQATGLAQSVTEAQSDPRKLNDHLMFHLNRWVNQAVAWIPVDWWDACDEPVPSDEELRELPCAVGTDMAQKIDLAASVAAFRLPLAEDERPSEVELVTVDDEDGEREATVIKKRTLSLDFRVALVPAFWLPEVTLRERARQDRVPYPQWAKDGLLRVVDGAIVGADPIVTYLVGRDGKSGLLTRFPRLKAAEFAYDPAFATEVALGLISRKIPAEHVVEVRQNFQQLSEACQVFEALVKAKRVLHGGHRLLRWNLENVAIKRDDAGRIRPVKPKKATKRIDGVIATILAISRLMLMAPEQKKKARAPKIWTPGGWVSAIPRKDGDGAAQVR